MQISSNDLRLAIQPGPMAQECDEMPVEDRILAIVKGNGVPDNYRDALFGDMAGVPDEAKPEYERIVNSLTPLLQPSKNPRLVLIGGGYGTGKTYTTAAMVMALSRAGHYSLWYDGRDFVNHSRAMATSKFTDVNWNVWMDRYRRARLVVIDEVLAGCNTPFAQERIEEVVNARYSAGKDTILTANALDTEAFRSVLGNRVIDRAMDGGGLLIWKGRSLRGRIETPEASVANA